MKTLYLLTATLSFERCITVITGCWTEQHSRDLHLGQTKAVRSANWSAASTTNCGVFNHQRIHLEHHRFATAIASVAVLQPRERP